MNTCFIDSTNNAFQKILKFFVRRNSTVLDLTYGRGLSWQNMDTDYRIIKVDKRKLFKDVIKSDFNEYLNKKEGS